MRWGYDYADVSARSLFYLDGVNIVQGLRRVEWFMERMLKQHNFKWVVNGMCKHYGRDDWCNWRTV